MSFMGGAECSTAGNPLSQFTKHVGDDKSLQHDRLVNRGPNAVAGGFRSTNRGPGQDEVSDLGRTLWTARRTLLTNMMTS